MLIFEYFDMIDQQLSKHATSMGENVFVVVVRKINFREWIAIFQPGLISDRAIMNTQTILNLIPWVFIDHHTM